MDEFIQHYLIDQIIYSIVLFEANHKPQRRTFIGDHCTRDVRGMKF